MLTINTNLSSLIVQSNLNKSTLGLNQAIERMTTGFKINHAKDNAANYSISTSMNTQISSLSVAEENVMMGMNMLETASSNADLLNSHVSRIRDLCEQACNGTYGENSIKAIEAEVQSRLAEINRIIENTEYNGIKLFGEEEKYIATESNFLKDITRITEDNIPSGYTAVTNADELKNALANDENIVLMNDIDLSGVNWERYTYSSTLDGNGFKIENLRNASMADFGLISMANNGTVIKNLEISNFDFLSDHVVMGGLIARATGNVVIDNCIGTNIDIDDSSYGPSGGFIGMINDSANVTITNSSFDGSVTGGGLVGSVGSRAQLTVENSYVTGTFSHYSYAGGIVALVEGPNDGGTPNVININDTIVNARIESSSGRVGSFIGYDHYNNTSINGTNSYGPLASISSSDSVNNNLAYDCYKSQAELDALIAAKSFGKILTIDYTSIPINTVTTLQVGINSDENSRIYVDTKLDLMSLQALKNADISKSSTLDVIDNLLNELSNYQTNIGASMNRLESALESISITSENLVSSLSTIRDADIADESSSYIKNQILQQAAATLLATANQSPAIALQLI